MTQSAICDFRLGAERLLASDAITLSQPADNDSRCWLSIQGRHQVLTISWDQQFGFGFGGSPNGPAPVEFVRNVDKALLRTLEIVQGKALSTAA